jgi:hypothetical protein
MRTRNSFLPGLATAIAAIAIAVSSSAAATGRLPTPPLSVLAPAIIGDSTAQLPYIEHITFGKSVCDTCPPRACPDEPLVVTISGFLPAGCVAFRGFREVPVGAPFTVLAADFVVDTCARVCPAILMPFSGSVVLPPHVPGSYSLLLWDAVRSCPDTNATALVVSRMIAYHVERSCPSPVPVDSLVRSFTSLRIVPEHPCTGDSLTLQLVKNGCPPCAHLTGLFQTRVRGLVASVDWLPHCVEFACGPETLSFGLGRFSAGAFNLIVNTDVHVLDTAVPDSTISYPTRLTFEVARSCDSTVAGCVFPLLGADSGQLQCALQVPAGESGDLVLFAQSDMPLGGLQGHLDCGAPFRITGMRSRPGLFVSWTPEGRGARYVLFGNSGMPIPAGRSAVLVVTLSADSTALPGTQAGLFGFVDLASGPEGENLPLCDLSTYRIAPISLCVSADAATCDANGDGRADVRDLVVMTRCLRHVLSPGDSLRICRDCDGDGRFEFADLFCCAHEILQRPFVPRDSVRTSDQLSVTLDEPQSFAGGLLVRVHVRGADALGAAMLRLRYPAERWRADIPVFSAARASAASQGWLPIVDCSRQGIVNLGGLRLEDQVSADLEFEVAFFPTAASQPGDRIETDGADLAALDGTVLEPGTALPHAELKVTAPPTGVVELSPASPNPFGRSTTFAVNLPRESDVDLAVHDLAGRRVATLAQGRLGAGRRTFTWNGNGARDGLYFVRLSVDGRVLSSRVALLRDGR